MSNWANEDLKKMLGTETVQCTICGKSFTIPKGSITIPKFCIRCFHEGIIIEEE